MADEEDQVDKWERVGRCATCGRAETLDYYSPCNRAENAHLAYKCGGACHAKRGYDGEFAGFCGPVVFAEDRCPTELDGARCMRPKGHTAACRSQPEREQLTGD